MTHPRPTHPFTHPVCGAHSVTRPTQTAPQTSLRAGHLVCGAHSVTRPTRSAPQTPKCATHPNCPSHPVCGAHSVSHPTRSAPQTSRRPFHPNCPSHPVCGRAFGDPPHPNHTANGTARGAGVTVVLDTSALLALAIDGTQRDDDTRRARRRPDLGGVVDGAHRGAAGDRPVDRRAHRAPRPGGRHPPGVGSPARRPRRPTLPRPGSGVGTNPAGPPDRRDPLRRRRTTARPDPVRHVRSGTHRRGHGPRLRRRQSASGPAP